MTPRKFLVRLLDEASRPYRAAGHFAYYFARGKLSSDCIFREMLRLGVFPEQGRFLDLGCGQAGFASWLIAARKLFTAGDWPADWPAPPQVIEFRGYELMQKDIDRALSAMTPLEPQVIIRQGDICKLDFGQADVITILDVLQYIDFPEQVDILRRIRAALPAGGMFLTRVGDADGGLYFHVCNWIDAVVSFVRGHRLPRLYSRPLKEWVELLRGLGFAVETVPMSLGKPFSNAMIVARVPIWAKE
jgi:SAM-dependent methyltransferase